MLLFILLVIVVIGIMNTLAIAIRERTREIGTLRAIGMQRRAVLRLFLLESALLGLAGVVGGALVGVGLSPGGSTPCTSRCRRRCSSSSCSSTSPCASRRDRW